MSIAIIGGGAAGMMAAAAALSQNPKQEIHLIEKNGSLGQKVLISGGGRCNVTTGFSDLRVIGERYPRGGKFLQSAFHRFPPSAVVDFFESRGVPLKTEADGRVFPVSNNGHDIVHVFEELFATGGIKLHFQTELAAVAQEEGNFELTFKNGEKLTVNQLILTTGGQAYRSTGSTGDGYRFAENLGHHITALAASLNSFITEELWPRQLAGVALKKVSLSVKTNKKQEWTGPVLFTHRGLTGPAVFALSSLIAFDDYTPQKPLELNMDLLPDLSAQALEQEYFKELELHSKKNFVNVLGHFIPKSLAAVLCEANKISEDRLPPQVGKKEKHQILEALKHLKLHLIGRAAGEEFVTAGGVDTDEVDPRTMQSKKTRGLYFAGEILNIDGFTGGYNLQAAWATGHLAGENAAAL